MQKHSPSAQPQVRRPSTGPGRLTTPQILVLAFAGILGSAGLILAAVFLLSPAAGPQAAATSIPTKVAQAPVLPAVSTPIIGAGEPVEPLTATQPVTISVPCLQGVQPARSASDPRVIDSATLEVSLDGSTIRGSYAGIDINPGGSAALAWLSGVMQNQPVLLVSDPSGAGANGQPAWYVFAGGRFINDDLVRQGYARVVTDGPALTCVVQFQQSEQIARVDQLGIWRATAVPTATFIPFVTLAPQPLACDCMKRPECSEFSTHDAAQTCYNACNDYNSRLDEDRDGIACESLP